MFQTIIGGQSPSALFKELVSADPSLTNADLALAFKKEFLSVSDEAIQSIWHWRRPGRESGIGDDRMDAIVAHYLKAAGYL
jgi:hypothetical protein